MLSPSHSSPHCSPASHVLQSQLSLLETKLLALTFSSVCHSVSYPPVSCTLLTALVSFFCFCHQTSISVIKVQFYSSTHTFLSIQTHFLTEINLRRRQRLSPAARQQQPISQTSPSGLNSENQPDHHQPLFYIADHTPGQHLTKHAAQELLFSLLHNKVFKQSASFAVLIFKGRSVCSDYNLKSELIALVH